MGKCDFSAVWGKTELILKCPNKETWEVPEVLVGGAYDSLSNLCPITNLIYFVAEVKYSLKQIYEILG